ncbi:UDP-N-acetylglucosamine 2-epimerase (non-hydrolyzing) [Enterococcus sp. MJM12]|uniref:UDP-N-acetylglucosamine 2-epimerase (non-hydrolyzing) n=1 Tax=Candidatus Enterococcus myersii TaxID=2815322 RepID=A0ABS3H813_9ENTE|nr:MULTISPECIES: UDP-N-acetylglucosamine 2-epimerase (non-hydrolyzing) [Enterococcus]MBO0449592.1 UDP-N-acetylglucosamine 2-epimerase (non-hydrolyzing) [Enterococcus sp. MJM12]MCD1024959.1 UDP-N-acetylglucosamine 2-epimerase (non-hydrolyzing) [Enterococcus sp. SMC-9]MDT2740673.1 UDP-N-acetylglucosamine 2-epimerase (non-hydrolyzing) [Enterococcus canintestini]
MTIKVMSIFGTRPEAIKMAPLIKALEKDTRFESIVTITAQHREMLDQVMEIFSLKADFDLDIMSNGQTLTDITTKVLLELQPVLKQARPDIVLVHGDTTTTFAAATAAFYQQIPIGHVEAGLRTYKKYSPYPEEANRQLTDVLSDLYFAPTATSAENLQQEHHLSDHIYITGNTAIDAMKYTLKKEYGHPALSADKKQILVTMHRRENLGDKMASVFHALRRLATEFPEVSIVFPMHKNPLVRQNARKQLGDLANVALIEPLDVVDFHNIAARSYLIMTDSGGVQEEAPSLGVPVLVLRDTTERPEGIKAGTLRLVGTDEEQVYEAAKNLLTSQEAYKKMAQAKNPYGDGKASERILNAIVAYFTKNNEGI